MKKEIENDTETTTIHYIVDTYILYNVEFDTQCQFCKLTKMNQIREPDSHT